VNRRHHPLLAPLLAVLALLLGLAGSASAAFNAAATDPHYGNFLLHTEAPARIPLAIADPARENGVWLYDSTLGVPVYVRQNPWTFFDPLGLASVKDSLKDNKLTIKEAKELSFGKGEAEAILDANKIKKVTQESVRKDIVGKTAFGEDYVKDNMVWPNEDTQYFKNSQSGMSVDEVVITETARRNQSLAKQMIVREFKDEKLKRLLQVAEYSTHLMMEGSMFAIPAAGGAAARLGTMATASALGAPAEMATNMVTVSRWGRPGLQTGDFVMKGGATKWNYFKSGKWQPGMGNRFTPYSAGEEFVVSKGSLASPSQAATATAADKGAAGLVKQAMGQRAYSSQ
jgi:hypothetical protein